MRAVILATLIAVVPGAAGAQQAGAAVTDDPVAAAVERVRADFNARLVDYDQRIRSLEARVDALEAEASGPGQPAPPPLPGEVAPPVN